MWVQTRMYMVDIVQLEVSMTTYNVSHKQWCEKCLAPIPAPLNRTGFVVWNVTVLSNRQ
jgi:hypothetical protein